MNPVPTVRPARSNPKARVPAKQLYLDRVVRLFKGGQAGTAVGVTVGDVATALGVPSTSNVNFKVLDVTAWNYTTLNANTNYLRVTGSGNLFEDADLVCEGEDVGTGTSLAGVHLNVPDLAAATLSGTTSTSTSLVSLFGAPTGGSTTQQTYCLDFHLKLQVQ